MEAWKSPTTILACWLMFGQQTEPVQSPTDWSKRVRNIWSVLAGLGNLIPQSIRDWWMGRTPAWRATTEAADQQIGKRSKVDVAYQANMTSHMKELARQEETAVAEYRKRTTGVDVNGGRRPGNNDTIVCDNMTIDNGRGGGLGPALLGAAFAAAVLYYFGWIVPPDKTPSPPPATESTDTDTDTIYNVVPIPGR